MAKATDRTIQEYVQGCDEEDRARIHTFNMQRAGAGCRGENQLGIANISVSWVSGAGGTV